MESKNTNIPKRRFSGFSDAWEQRKLSSMILDIADGPFGSNLKTEHYTEDKEARIIQLSNLSDEGWQEENTRYTTFEHAKEIRRCIVNEGEMVMGKMMPAGMTIMRPNAEKMYVLSSDCVRIKLDKNSITNEFFLYETKSAPFLEQVNNDSQGSTRVRTSISKIRDMDFVVPSLKEQEQIGAYFKNLDHLITLHQRKLDKLKDMKKSYLSEMFPQLGEKKPRRRFKGFTEDWEQRKLSEFGQATGGTSIESEFSEDGIYKVISIGSYSEDSIYRDQGIRAVRSDKTVNKILNKGNITMILNDKTASGNIIGRVLLIEESGVYVYNQRTERIEVDSSNYDSQFIYTMLNAPEIREKIIKQSQGNTQIYVNWTTVSQTDYLVPQIDEQRKIGEYFSNLDHLITLHQRKLDKLKNIKQAYLNEMFVK